MRTCPAPGAVVFLSTSEKTPGDDISTALYVSAIGYPFVAAKWFVREPNSEIIQ
jgi:hypothetical protein